MAIVRMAEIVAGAVDVLAVADAIVDAAGAVDAEVAADGTADVAGRVGEDTKTSTADLRVLRVRNGPQPHRGPLLCLVNG